MKAQVKWSCKLFQVFVVVAYIVPGHNPSSPKSDQYQVSPYNINTQIKRKGNENQGHDHQIETEFSQLVP